jgi:hypothetical protein
MAASLLILPMALSAAMYAPEWVLRPFSVVGDYAHLLAMRPFYEAEMAPLRDQRQPIFHVFDWGGFAGTNIFVIYDESDRVSLPSTDQEWGSLGGGLAGECAGRAYRISGHYYRCTP